jgi:hypothetical protein
MVTKTSAVVDVAVAVHAAVKVDKVKAVVVARVVKLAVVAKVVKVAKAVKVRAVPARLVASRGL